MENVVITTMAFEPLANGERAFFRLRKIVGEEDSSTEHDRLRRRAATNEDALERVACAALSVYPHYQVWSASGGKCGAHSRAFLFSDWCIAVATWPAIGRLHTTNSRGVHYPWGTQLHIRRKHTRPLSILHKRYSARIPHTHEYTYIYICVCIQYTHVYVWLLLARGVRTHRSHRHIFVCGIYWKIPHARASLRSYDGRTGTGHKPRGNALLMLSMRRKPTNRDSLHTHRFWIPCYRSKRSL